MKFADELHELLGQSAEIGEDAKEIRAFMNRPICQRIFEQGDEEDREALGSLFEGLVSNTPQQV